MGLHATRRIGAALLAGALLTSACTDGEPAAEPSPTASAEAPSPTASAESPAPTEIDVTTLPDELTPEYVQAVLDEITEIRAEATRVALTLEPYPASVGELPDELVASIESAHDGGQAAATLESVLREASPESRDGLASPYEGYDYQLRDFESLAPDCLLIDATVDLTGVLSDPPAEQPLIWVVLSSRRSQSADAVAMRLVALAPQADAERPSEGDC